MVIHPGMAPSHALEAPFSWVTSGSPLGRKGRREECVEVRLLIILDFIPLMAYVLLTFPT